MEAPGVQVNPENIRGTPDFSRADKIPTLHSPMPSSQCHLETPHLDAEQAHCGASPRRGAHSALGVAQHLTSVSHGYQDMEARVERLEESINSERLLKVAQFLTVFSLDFPLLV